MSSLNTTHYAKNKEQIASIKREFRNSFDDELNSIGIAHASDIECDFSSTSYHITTTADNDWENDKVKVRASLLDSYDGTFTLSIDSKNEYFERNQHFTLYMNDDLRLQLIEALSNVVVHEIDK